MTKSKKNKKQSILKLDKKESNLHSSDEDFDLHMRKLSSIYDMTKTLTANLSINLVVQSIYDQVYAAISPDEVFVFLLDKDELVLQYTKQKTSDFMQTISDGIHINQCLCGIAAFAGESAFSIDINTDKRYTLGHCKEIGITSFGAIPIRVENNILGILGVGSTKTRDFSQEANFLETIAGQCAIALQNSILQKKLQIYTERINEQRKYLEETNSSFKILLDQRERDKLDLEENILSNIKNIVDPFLDKLKESNVSDKQKIYINVIELHLKEIISPFTRRLASKYVNLTPAEIQIATLIKQGKTTKDIADLLNLSLRTINFHRDNIRDKLGLKNEKVNLRSHLMTLT